MRYYSATKERNTLAIYNPDARLFNCRVGSLDFLKEYEKETRED